MKILVTGGCGFIGSNYVRYMLDKYDDVRIINVDNLSYGSNIENLRGLDKEKHKFVKDDITNSDLMRRIVREIDAVVNLAAQTHVDRSIANPYPFLKSNVEGVLSILEALKEHDEVKMVHVSTDEVYGDISSGSFKEEDRLKPSSSYAASKASADMFCLAYHRTYGLDITIIRPTNNFGPYQFPEKLIPKTIIRAILGLKVPIYGSGKNIRDWIYVLDTCEAIDLALRKGKAGEIYNVSAGNEYENIEVVEKILEIMGKRKDLVKFVEDRPGHDIRYSLNSTKIRRDLGWKSKYEFDRVLEKTVKWYIENEWWWRPLATEQVLHPTPWELKW